MRASDGGGGAGGGTRRRNGLSALMTGLSWWQAVLVAVPLPLIGIGGAVGGFIGGTAAAANATLARRNRFGAGITALSMTVVSLFAYGGYFAVAGALHSAFSSHHTSAPLDGPIVVTTTPSPTPYRTPQLVQPWKPVPPGVIPNQPRVVTATGAQLTWPAYDNTTGDPRYDVARYEVYRIAFGHSPSASPGTLIGSVPGDRTAYADTGAPARTGPRDGIYTYLIGVRTKGGRLIEGTPVDLQLPMPGRTEIAIPATAAATIASGRPNAPAAPVLAQHFDANLEIGPDEDLGLGNTRMVFGFGPLAALPNGASLVEAHLSVWRTSGGNYPDQYTLYALRRSFTGPQVTWRRASKGAAWNRPGGDYGAPTGRVLPSTEPGTLRSDFDATAAVRGWLRDPRSEHGLLLRADTESVRTAPLLNGFYVPVGGAYPTYPAWDSPELTLTYTTTPPPPAFP